MEIKKQISKLRAQIAQLQGNLKGAKGEFKKDLLSKIAMYQKQLDALLAENPHDDGTGRKPTSYNMMKDPKK